MMFQNGPFLLFQNQKTGPVDDSIDLRKTFAIWIYPVMVFLGKAPDVADNFGKIGTPERTEYPHPLPG